MATEGGALEEGGPDHRNFCWTNEQTASDEPSFSRIQVTSFCTSGPSSKKSTAPGFLMSVMSVSRDLEYIVTRVMDKTDSDNSMVARLVQTMLEYSKQVGYCDLLEVNYQDRSLLLLRIKNEWQRFSP